MGTLNNWIVGLRVWGLWGALLLLVASGQLNGQSSGTLTSEQCGSCHARETQVVVGTPHTTTADSAISCESCHGPVVPHIGAQSAPELALFSEGQPAIVNDTCLACHGMDVGQATHAFSSHLAVGVSCSSCHQVHGDTTEALLAMPSANELCSSCHSDVRAQFKRPFRHRLEEGAISCVDCHSSHGRTPPTQLARLVGAGTGCVKCHGEKRGPFPFEHAPVRLEPCSSCHEPHGSVNPSMLTRHNVSQLCLECHTLSGSTLGGAPAGFHDVRSPRFQNCTVCHSKTHGSFVDPAFLR